MQVRTPTIVKIVESRDLNLKSAGRRSGAWVCFPSGNSGVGSLNTAQLVDDLVSAIGRQAVMSHRRSIETVEQGPGFHPPDLEPTG